MVAELCKILLEADFDIVGIVNDGQQLMRSALDLRPDVVVLGISLPILNGLEAGKRLKAELSTVKLVYLTSHRSEELAAEAMLLGISGYVVKTCAASELTAAIWSVLGGVSYICRAIRKDEVNRLIWEHRGAPKQRLTPKQRDVLQLLAEGRRMKEVGTILGIAARTVAFHKYRTMNTLGLKTDADLFLYAMTNHLVGGARTTESS